MTQDLYELKDEFKNQPTPEDFITTAWETSTKNHTAIMYVLGALDALMYANLITPEFYTEMYDKTY